MASCSRCCRRVPLWLEVAAPAGLVDGQQQWGPFTVCWRCWSSARPWVEDEIEAGRLQETVRWVLDVDPITVLRQLLGIEGPGRRATLSGAGGASE